jgi:hypothetical protein
VGIRVLPTGPKRCCHDLAAISLHLRLLERRAAVIGTRGYKPFGFGSTLRTSSNSASPYRNQRQCRTSTTQGRSQRDSDLPMVFPIAFSGKIKEPDIDIGR